MKNCLTTCLVLALSLTTYGQTPSQPDLEALKHAKVLELLSTPPPNPKSNLPEQDCFGAIPVCQTIYYQPNSYDGQGLLNEINPAFSCLGAGELNSVWYRVIAAGSGFLGFNITPNTSTDDYDWAVYNLTNHQCSDTDSIWQLEVGCDFSGSVTPTPITGPNNGSNPQDEALIPVNAGEIYYIVISNFSSNQGGYTLDFAPSTIPIGECSFIYGNVYLDQNENCQLEQNDVPLQGQVVMALPGPISTLTGVNGFYSIGIPNSQLGEYQLFTQPQSPAYESNCPTSPSFITVNVTQTDSVYSGNDFAYKQNSALPEPCPDLGVSVASTPFLFCCGGNTFVRVCNNGTAPAENATLTLNIDVPFLGLAELYDDMDSLYIPTQVGTNNVYQIGNLAISQCIDLYVNIFISDVNAFVNALNLDTQNPDFDAFYCINAHVTPDDVCGPISPNWDGSNMSLETSCADGDAVFTLTNNGSGNMANPKGYVVYNGQTEADEGTYQLAAGQSVTYTYPTGGGLFVFQAEQSDFNPYSTQPHGYINNCGDSVLVQEFSFNDFSSPYGINSPYAQDCSPLFFAYDPNDKQAVPVGLGPEHYISANDEIEYTIRFQNTGNAPAAKVVVVDSLDYTKLNLLSLNLGAASHPYQAELVGAGVLKFTFNNIMLPPVSQDSLGSIGVVSFKIKQNYNNPISYTINNKAYIYFDLNAPIITNNVFHNVKDNLANSVNNTGVNNSLTSFAYPNPTNGLITIVIPQKNTNTSFNVEVYNTSGQLVTTLANQSKGIANVNVEGLPTGLYNYHITTADGKTAAGRFVKH